MPRPSKQIIERLGPNGLTRALDDLCDQSRLVHLANTCGLKYRGMRTQSQTRARLIKDLVEKARKRDDVGKAVLRTLAKEDRSGRTRMGRARRRREGRGACATRSTCKRTATWGSTSTCSAREARPSWTAWVCAWPASISQRLATNGDTPASPSKTPKTPRGEARLQRQVQERDRKLRHLEAQLAKVRETQKTTKQDLIQRKGELAESRMLVERLRRERSQAQNAVRAATSEESSAPSNRAVSELTRATRQLAAEQKKLVHGLETPKRRLRAGQEKPSMPCSTRSSRRTSASPPIRSPATSSSRRSPSASKRCGKRCARDPARPPAKPKRARPRGQARRVGVFIDVQNMYYGARRLKGKLDFDRLLEAAVGQRRLIKTTAYVVESKEIDQSQFIAMLQKRAIEVRRKTVQVRADGSKKGDWDMELALDILDAAPGLDVVVLVSGDGDFTSLVKRVKSMGPRVEVIAFPRTAAKSLVQAADDFRPLDRKFMIYSRPVRTASTPASAGQGLRRQAAQAQGAGSRHPDPAHSESTNPISPVRRHAQVTTTPLPFR